MEFLVLSRVYPYLIDKNLDPVIFSANAATEILLQETVNPFLCQQGVYANSFRQCLTASMGEA